MPVGTNMGCLPEVAHTVSGDVEVHAVSDSLEQGIGGGTEGAW